MLSLSDCLQIAKEAIPYTSVEGAIEYRDEYVFVIYRSADREGMFDPFYAVNKSTGIFREFSVITDGVTSDIMYLFKDSNLLTAK